MVVIIEWAYLWQKLLELHKLPMAPQPTGYSRRPDVKPLPQRAAAMCIIHGRKSGWPPPPSDVCWFITPFKSLIYPLKMLIFHSYVGLPEGRYILNLVGGWPTPLKNDGVKVSWDDEIPNGWKNKIHVPNHQSVNNYKYQHYCYYKPT